MLPEQPNLQPAPAQQALGEAERRQLLVGITQGCHNHEDLGGSTSSELQDLFTHDKNYLGSAGLQT